MSANPPWAILLAISLATTLGPTVRAASLASLFQGGSITDGNNLFSNWSLETLEITGAGLANLDQIDVFPLGNDPLRLGMGFTASIGALGTTNDHVDLAAVQLAFTFDVQTVDGTASIAGHSVEIQSIDLRSHLQSVVRIYEDINPEFGAYLSRSVAIFESNDPSDVPTLFGESEFERLSFCHAQRSDRHRRPTT